MTELKRSFEFIVTPVPPYNFHLTVRNPAGWFFFTPFEIYEGGALWTSTHILDTLVGLKLSSEGNVEQSRITVRVFSEKDLAPSLQENIKEPVNKALGADQDLTGFYKMAGNDNILEHVVEDLYGMHDRSPVSIFPEAVLAILLQMAPLKRSNDMMSSFIQNYGDVAEFDGKKVLAWPTPERTSKVQEEEMVKKCKVGYRAKYIIKIAQILSKEDFPSMEQLGHMEPEKAKKLLIELPGIGDYSADIINPHGGFPIDVWSAEVFGKLFFGKKPDNNREAVEIVKKEGIRRWGKWAWMAFFYIVQDLPNLSRKLGMDLRLA